ncbi:hypothetical protein VM1G_02098 [Cytospora mali]|uniref:Uncharacterized protein n=1 Tax=Cytospora mali TaxID=578113 RepID=A0A194VRK7_CYTMA|nr:hypothetical protein VM1G_02098 [Valsa mali]
MFQTTRKHFEAFARAEFQKYVAIEKRDFAAIEFLLRKGRRQLERSPHRRPNVKVARTAFAEPSASQPPQPKNPSTKAAQDVFKKPLSPPVSRLRRAQQALIGRRRRVSNRNSRVRVSFAHSSSSTGLHPSGTRSSGYGRKHFSNCESSIDPSQWIGSLETPRRRDADPYPPMGRPAPPPKDTVRHRSQLQSTAARSGRPDEEGVDSRYSLMQVPEDPGYYVPTPKRKPEYAHVGSLDGSSNNIEYTKFPRANAKRHGSYVARAPPSSKRVSTRPVKPIRDLRQHGTKISSMATRDKRRAVLDPLVENSLVRSLSQQNRLSCLKTPPKWKARSGPASPPPRAPSQQRSLTRFTKELERYCMAVNANGKAPLPLCTPTVSESPTTLDTVTELLPYHRQFKAAGLAVTSQEQMPRIPESIQQQSTARETGNGRQPPVARVQIDGSTVTPSEQDLVSEDATSQAVARNETTVSSEPRASTKQVKTVNKSSLPWIRNKDATVAHKTHSGRNISGGHLHPSQAMAAQPVLTPSDKLGIIDAYFNFSSPDKLQDKQPETRKKSLSTPSKSSSKETSLVDKPLPKEPLIERRPSLSKQPPIERRPLPPRSGRRHMENTSQWPTARVLIHDSSPPPLGRHADDDAEEVAEVKKSPQLPSKDLSSSHSSSPPSVEVIEATSQHSTTPPAEMTRFVDADDNLLTPPNDDSNQQAPPTAEDSRHHRGQSLCKQWSKVTVLRRRSRARHVPMPTIIQEEPETSPEKKKHASASSQQKGKEKHPIKSRKQAQLENTKPDSPTHISEQALGSVPQLPYTWKYAVESSSSFEKALDAVIQKLDDMEERRQHERHLDFEAARKTITENDPPKDASVKESSSKPISGPHSKSPPEHHVPIKPSAPKLEVVPETGESVDYLDRDINDRDILLGLKMAISAACDPDLDAWIRDKTGLRLRRFLADLKAFDAVSKDGKPTAPAPQPLHRQIRRNGNEARRLKAERERRRQSMKKTLLPCLSTDSSPAESG